MVGGGDAWQGDVCGRGACMAGGHEWQGGVHGRFAGGNKLYNML